jgi:hypothetical protein
MAQALGGFYVGPADYSRGLDNLTQAAESNRNQKRMQEQADYQANAKQAVIQAVRSGDPSVIRDVSIQYPEFADTAKQAFGFTNAATEKVARETYRRVLSDPANAFQIMSAGADEVERLGGRPKMMRSDARMFLENPEGALQNVKMGFAAIASEQEYESLSANSGASPKFGNVQPGDFTPPSLQKYSQTGDYRDLERYESAKSVNIGGVPHVFDPAFGGYRPASVSSGGAPVNATAQSVGASEGEIAAAVDTAKAEVKTPKDLKDIRMNIDTSEEVSRQTDSLLNNQGYISSITGINGKLPKIPGSEGFDAQIAFEQLKNTLTLGNLDKMSGVLSETDIKILSSAASGLELGMSESALKDRLGIISRVFKSKTIEERRKLEEIMSSRPQSQSSGGQKMTDESADDFINSVLGQ